ncbi:MAG: hypothetical protein JWO68_4037, partial [Actinomycetia bacterium]|nr:hypothetical protein [Actinomycetes bacterium]
LPAQLFMLAILLCVGWLLLTPSEYHDLGRLVAANAIFVANIVLARDTGYFAAAAETKPLLHTWSLAVEEQFYVFWPLLLLFCLKSRRLLVVTVIGGAVTSFLLACHFIMTKPSEVFYLLPTRAWELMMGGMAALGIVRAPPTLKGGHALGALGLILIVASAYLLDKTSPFPAWNALWPCAGALLVILSGVRHRSISCLLLSWKLLVWIGLISYSLYLWHWPVLVLGGFINNGRLTDATVLVLMLCTFVLATLSWRYIEVPFRKRHETRNAVLLARYAGVCGLIFSLGFALKSMDGVPSRVAPDLSAVLKAAQDVNPLQQACMIGFALRPPAFPTRDCVHGPIGAEPSVLIWGDSHANSIAPGVAAVVQASGRSMYQATVNTCPPLLGVRSSVPGWNLTQCPEYNRLVLEGIKARPELRTVVLAARWSFYAETSRFGEEQGRVVVLVDDETRTPGAADTKRVIRDALIRTISELQAAGKAVVVVSQVPEVGVDVPSCVTRNAMQLSVKRPCQVSQREALERTAFIDTLVRSVHAPERRVCAVVPSAIICSEATCRSVLSGKPIYVDDDHLTTAGAQWLMKQMDFDACL